MKSYRCRDAVPRRDPVPAAHRPVVDELRAYFDSTRWVPGATTPADIARAVAASRRLARRRQVRVVLLVAVGVIVVALAGFHLGRLL
ncbi:hypothetical protein [Actinoplanes sp. NPDC051494]|uniref:hypothetical protein n=1 Tax=Actinoplanes sp. NPDC051494 TaxID=3363907 RepID=UPI0037B59926